jgi:anti-sigma regulatory factor (Ser/Thr protein kinase)
MADSGAPDINESVVSMHAGIVLDPLPASVPRARSWAASTLADWGCDGLVDDVRLVVSELVGNGVRHAGTDLSVDLRLDADTLRVEVTDEAPGRVAPDPPDPFAANGRGLGIVGGTSDRWGIAYAPEGKTVWAEWHREDGRPTP